MSHSLGIWSEIDSPGSIKFFRFLSFFSRFFGFLDKNPLPEMLTLHDRDQPNATRDLRQLSVRIDTSPSHHLNITFIEILSIRASNKVRQEQRALQSKGSL